MAHRLILLHGMGTFEDGWADEVLDKLETLYNSYDREPALLTRKSFAERIQPVPLRYDDIFVEILTEWAENNEAIAEQADDLDAAAIERLTSFLDSDDLSEFAWTHVADVLLYRGFSLVRERVKATLANRLATAIDEAIEQDDSWSVLAHSLGTSVLHDTLHGLFAGQFEGLDAPNAQAVMVMMVSNVSRLLQTVPRVLEVEPAPQPSLIKPGSPGDGTRACQLYLNVAHFLDPFLRPKPFDPVQWPDPAPSSNDWYQRIEIRHIHQANVHSLLHYLDHPAVHIPLFRALTWESSITKEQERTALDAFPQFGALGQAAGIAVKDRLDDAQVGGPQDTWKSLEAIGKAYRDAQ